MNEQEKRELNEKLAKWAGFTFLREGFREGRDTWRYTDGSTRTFLPDFCDSLDAQAKWLWPKLVEVHSYISMSQISHTEFGATVRRFATNKLPGRRFESDATDEPALACAIAIGKLIDSEVTAE